MCYDIIMKMFPDFANTILMKWFDSIHSAILNTTTSAFVSEMKLDSNDNTNNNYKIFHRLGRVPIYSTGTSRDRLDWRVEGGRE